ncbi:uncharacterized protein LOC135495915 [Lineus longissimus]|uniref:uncharacterized protein LOC135495915 n=1 Tax=Lineus longissimus TaxID=88925 RepID=UPI00315CC5A3
MAQQKKDQLREFLRQRLDAGETPSALKWTNKDNFEFRLEWKHKKDKAAGRNEDAIFREWAKHKGNDTREITKLKENFRKALQKSPFVEILQEGKTLAYKICRLKYDSGENAGTPGTRRRKEARGQAINAEIPQIVKPLSDADNRRLRATYEDMTPPMTPPPVEASCPSITDIDLDVSMETPLNSEEWQELFEDFAASQPEDMITEECGVVMHMGGQEPMICQGENYPVLSPHRLQEMEEQHEPITLPSNLTTGHYHGIDFRKAECCDGSVRLGVHDIFVLIKHRRCVLNRCHIACHRGFRINYLKPGARDCFEGLGAELIRPDIHPFSEVENGQVTRARLILEAMNQGLYIFADEEGNIHAVRISSLNIFYANTILRGNQASPEILPINEDVIVFDHKVYMKAFENWVKNKGTKPDVRVLFSVSEKWSLADPHDKCAITITIANARLLFQKKQFGQWWNNGPIPV